MSWTPPRCPCLPYSTHQQGPSAPPPKSYPEPRNFSPPAPLCLLLHPATIPWPWDCTSLLPQWAPSFWLHPTVCSLHRHSCQRDPARTKSQHTPPLLRAPPHGSHLPKSKKPKSSQWPRDPYRLSDLISRPSTLASLLWSLNISSTFLPGTLFQMGFLYFRIHGSPSSLSALRSLLKHHLYREGHRSPFPLHSLVSRALSPPDNTHLLVYLCAVCSATEHTTLRERPFPIISQLNPQPHPRARQTGGAR